MIYLNEPWPYLLPSIFFPCILLYNLFKTFSNTSCAKPCLIWKKTSHFSKKITTPSTLSEVVLLFKSLFHSVLKYALKFDGNWCRDLILGLLLMEFHLFLTMLHF